MICTDTQGRKWDVERASNGALMVHKVVSRDGSHAYERHPEERYGTWEHEQWLIECEAQERF